MKFRNYLLIWITFLLLLSFEYWNLNFKPSQSLFLFLQNHNLLSKNNVFSPEPGRYLSLWLGWLGIGLMVLMNIYSLRKRFNFMNSLGRLSSWLNFHVFCGLLGPTFIFFHCNFKVRGLVGISFWSMVISFSSGVIGRYFYLQLAGKKNEIEILAEKYKERLLNLLEKNNIKEEVSTMEKVLKLALQQVGLKKTDEEIEETSSFMILWTSMISDFKMAFEQVKIKSTWPETSRELVKQYALHKRKAAFLQPFEQLMGYWHAFHFPFAVFMYLAAIIHIIAALIFAKGH